MGSANSAEMVAARTTPQGRVLVVTRRTKIMARDRASQEEDWTTERRAGLDISVKEALGNAVMTLECPKAKHTRGGPLLEVVAAAVAESRHRYREFSGPVGCRMRAQIPTISCWRRAISCQLVTIKLDVLRPAASTAGGTEVVIL